jgi:hypothetical protein
MRARYASVVASCCAAALVAAGGGERSASALDKQGSAHGGAVGDDGADARRFDVSGAAMLGVSLLNDSYAARPNNTGLTLLRYALHGDVDLIGRYLSIPIDVSMFTDRTIAQKLVPTELDVIFGATTTWRLHKALALEVGLRGELDSPLYYPQAGAPGQPPNINQAYGDARARLLFSLASSFPKLRRDLVDGDISGFVTLGAFAINPSYAARPDNSGHALFRYALHTELSTWHDYVSLGLDLTMFTDRDAAVAVAPSELDVTYEIIGHVAPFEVHLAYERDMPIDRGGLVQSFVYALLVYELDFKRAKPLPVETRTHIPSP